MSSPFKIVIVTLLVGIAAGITGIVLSLLLHGLQHLAYGYSLNQIISHETFLEGVRAASAYRRLGVLVVCGLVAGIGWGTLFYFWGQPVAITKGMKDEPPKMPVRITLVHAVLQIITVALGSPLGREVAPREVSALAGGWFSQKWGLSQHDSQIAFACGAGAGLAAVYNVPLAGALFSLEVLLLEFRWSVVIRALMSSVIAAMVTWTVLGNEQVYELPIVQLNASLIGFAILFGPFCGALACFFNRAIMHARTYAPKDMRVIPALILNFALVGAVAMAFPEILGNGKGPVQLSFHDAYTLSLVTSILILKFLMVYTSIRAGAAGGTLTPSLALGALLAVLLSFVWNSFMPPVPMSSVAIVGATAFLATTMNMPLTAVILIFEMTRVNNDALVPILLALIGSILVAGRLAAST